MSTTYSTDEEIAAECPTAAGLLSGTDTLERVRGIVYERINRALWRRSPSISPDQLSDSTELTSCEVYGVLAELHYKAASRAGYDGSDWYAQEGRRYNTMYEHELASPVSVAADLASTFSIRMRRG